MGEFIYNSLEIAWVGIYMMFKIMAFIGGVYAFFLMLEHIDKYRKRKNKYKPKL